MRQLDATGIVSPVVPCRHLARYPVRDDRTVHLAKCEPRVGHLAQGKHLWPPQLLDRSCGRRQREFNHVTANLTLGDGLKAPVGRQGRDPREPTRRAQEHIDERVKLGRTQNREGNATRFDGLFLSHFLLVLEQRNAVTSHNGDVHDLGHLHRTCRFE